MEENLISINLPNTISVLVMVMVGFLVLGLLAQGVHHARNAMG